MSFSFGGSSGHSRGETTVSPRELTKEERALLRTQNQVLGIELEQLLRQNELLAGIFPEAKQIFESLAEATKNVVSVFGEAVESLRETGAERELRGVAAGQALSVLRGEAPIVSAQEQALIDQIYAVERARGTEEITRFAQEAAAARGLNLTDTPIAGEATKAVRQLGEGIAGDKARTTLAFGQQQQQFREAVRQFQEGLRFQAQQNRLALTGMSPFALQAPVSTVTPYQAGQNATSGLATLIGRPTNSQFSGSSSGSYWGANINLAQIIGAVAGAASSAKLKKDIVPLDAAEYAAAQDRRGVRLPVEADAYDDALDKLRATPITRWKYKWEPDDRRPHIGPILELSPEEIQVGDGVHLSLLDYAGLTHAAVKALDRRVTRLALEAAR